MEPKYSILLYSKYSDDSKRLIENIRNSGTDFSFLQLVCIDNEKIRSRIKNNNLDITTVPTILRLFENGTIEKYDNNFCFEWVDNIINIHIEEEKLINQKEQQRIQEAHMEQMRMQELQQQMNRKKRNKSQETEEENIQNIQYLEERNREEEKEEKEEEEEEFEDPALENDDDEENEFDDRNVSRPIPKRIRKDENNYEEDDTLFSGDAVDNRREPSNSVRAKTKRPTKDQGNAMSKAEAMQQERAQIEEAQNPNTKRPQQPPRQTKIKLNR